MILDLKDEQLPLIDRYGVAELAVSQECVFWLAGSHFMRCANEDSDLDLIASFEGVTIDFLTELGFIDIGLPDYISTGGTTLVMRRGESNTKVDVLLCDWPEAKVLARDIVVRDYMPEHITADAVRRDEIWTAAYQQAKTELNKLHLIPIDDLSSL